VADASRQSGLLVLLNVILGLVNASRYTMNYRDKE
jgi:hypothetical protein